VLVAVGLGAGFPLAAGTTRAVSGLIFGARGSTSEVWAAVAVLLTAITLVACYVPARRATKADPTAALRAE
jgi:putative ABC transport system permease protein